MTKTDEYLLNLMEEILGGPVKRKIPCGRVLGHGECCCEGWLCDTCEGYQKVIDGLNKWKQMVENSGQ